MISMPGLRCPSFSATITMLAAMRALTEAVGLRPSIFASTVAWLLSILLSCIRGVLPIESELFL